MKKSFKLILVMLLFVALVGCNKMKPGVRFDNYMDVLFLQFLGNDPYNVNSTLLYPAEYGIQKTEVTAYEFGEEGEKEYYQYLKSVRNYVSKFRDKDLTEDQRLTKKIVIDYLDRKIAFDGLYYYGSNLGSYLGYQAQLPIILAEYRFDDKDDIEDYFAYLQITEENFKAIVGFEKEKIAKNMGLTDPIIQKVIAQCETFINVEENYLIAVFNEKIDALPFLSSQDKTTLKARNLEYVSNDFVGAYQYLARELKSMLGTATHNGSIANFPEGKRYYEALFRQATGTNMSVPEAKAYLEDTISRVMGSVNSNYEYYHGLDLMGSKKLEDLMGYFEVKMKDDFPELSIEVDYTIKEISDSMKENSSPAMYFISPLDANVQEVIYINPLNFAEEDNYVYQTIAHEGYPGHLYQNVYLKTSNLPDVRKNLHYVGYSEGWSTYVENYVVGYVNKEAKAAFEYYDSLTYVFLGLLDIGINYEGWSMDQAYNFMKKTFVGISREASDELFYDLTEIPTNYLQYYFSYYQVQDLKRMFQEQMGDAYSDLLFHTIYLETGPASFPILEEQYKNYKR